MLSTTKEISSWSFQSFELLTKEYKVIEFNPDKHLGTEKKRDSNGIKTQFCYKLKKALTG